jgi:hypothetical protein
MYNCYLTNSAFISLSILIAENSERRKTGANGTPQFPMEM